MRSPARWIATLLLAALALASAACSFPAICVVRTASCPGLTFAAVERVIRGDPSFEGVTLDRYQNDVGLSCTRGGEHVSVHLDTTSSELRVSVGLSGDSATEKEALLWTEQVGYVTGKLSAECPEIQAWTNHDNLRQPADSPALAVVFLAFVGGVLTLIVLVVRARLRFLARTQP